MAIAKAGASDRRADRFKWAVSIVPLLGICCILITLLVVMGLIELAVALITHHRLFAIR